MSRLSAIWSALKGEVKTVDLSQLTWAMLDYTNSRAGVVVNIDRALRVGAVLACLRVIAEGVAQVGCKLYQQIDKSKEEARDNSLFDIIHRRPNEWMTSFEFMETLTLHAALDKGGFAYINWSEKGEVLELLPLLPSRVNPMEDTAWNVVYEVTGLDGARQVVPRENILAIRGPGWLDFRAMPLVAEAREAIGLAITLEESQARFAASGSRPSGFISTPKPLGKEAVKRLAEMWQADNAGLVNSGRVPIFDNDTRFYPMGLTSVDAEQLNSRKFQVEDIARIFRVFPLMIGIHEKTSTYASVEQFAIMHVTHTLGPWFARWEQALDRDLLSQNQRTRGYYFKCPAQVLMRGDSAARSAFYKAAISDGWMTRNEARELEEMNPIPGLDVPLMPLNMADGTKPPEPPQPKPSNTSSLVPDLVPKNGVPKNGVPKNGATP